MKAYLTIYDEPTATIALLQLRRLGFTVEVMDEKEDWADKYLRFVTIAKEDCIRVDADVILNSNIKAVFELRREMPKIKMAQWKTYDFYRNNVGVTSPVYYTAEALKIIRANLKKINWKRPEATAWRLPEINFDTWTGDEIVGMHGFFQGMRQLRRHYDNKTARKQLAEYNFDLAIELLALRPG